MNFRSIQEAQELLRFHPFKIKCSEWTWSWNMVTLSSFVRLIPTCTSSSDPVDDASLFFIFIASSSERRRRRSRSAIIIIKENTNRRRYNFFDGFFLKRAGTRSRVQRGESPNQSAALVIIMTWFGFFRAPRWERGARRERESVSELYVCGMCPRPSHEDLRRVLSRKTIKQQL